jgi:hypothetical protein
VTISGRLYCWGKNDLGELGDGSITNQITPKLIIDSDVMSDFGGQNQACALKLGGYVYCWGYNGNGQLGDGTTATRYFPQLVPTLSSGISTMKLSWHLALSLQALFIAGDIIMQINVVMERVSSVRLPHWEHNFQRMLLQKWLATVIPVY